MIALCKCGVDMVDHDDVSDHQFDASGTKHPCGAVVNGYHCPLPYHHAEHGVPCGPITGKKLWE